MQARTTTQGPPSHDTVGERNPAPPGVYININPANNGINYKSTGAGYLPSTVTLSIPWVVSLSSKPPPRTPNNPTIFSNG